MRLRAISFSKSQMGDKPDGIRVFDGVQTVTTTNLFGRAEYLGKVVVMS